MAAAQLRPLCVGFSSATRVARFQLGNLEVSFRDAGGQTLTFVLTEEVLRLVDLNLERLRREEHEATLLTMHEGETGLTLWHAAGAGGLRDTVFLLARRANFHYWHSQATHSSSAVMQAALNGHLEVVTALMDRRVHRLDESFLCAATGGHTLIMGMLIDRGADVQTYRNQALQRAAQNGHLHASRFLLDRGARPLGGLLSEVRQRGHEEVYWLLRQLY